MKDPSGQSCDIPKDHNDHLVWPSQRKGALLSFISSDEDHTTCVIKHLV
ncbi:hypothetical protein JCM19237_940 [Photobacterium aphoticum]|uniref:Uncharacterized protein n=1 Tax=Photobacterium aphoticum TaxID=754436 RepID=A0A090RJL1_9GAMM|nr:hypothetical protein JCM19237_940 [Photobacterium aphoticum]